MTHLQRGWHDVAVLVVDEVNILSPENIYEFSARLRHTFPHKKHSPLVGLYVITIF